MLKKLILIISGVLLVLLAVLLFNTITFQSKQSHVEHLSNSEKIDQVSINRLSEAITIKTISFADSLERDTSQFARFHYFLSENYPLTDSLLQKETLNRWGLLYKWEGKNPNLKPVILMGHYDVVPVEQETIQEWGAPPFAGKIIDDVIWGRGTLDDKAGVIGIMEAVEHLLNEGFTPSRTSYLAFGHDEEVGGREGAAEIATYLNTNQINAEFVLDEGGVITQGLVPGIDKDVALIGIAEKGYLSVTMKVKLEGGHSSMPPKETAISILSMAINRLNENQMPARISSPLQKFLNYIGPEMPFLQKVVFANSWLFKSLILDIYQKTPSGNASVRTTTAPTIFKSGVKDNVIPTEAVTTVNFRVLPGETSEDVLEHVKGTIDDDRIILGIDGFTGEPSEVSGTNTPGFKLIERTIKQTFPETLVAPSLVIGATDSRYYHTVSANVYRFLPVTISQENINSIHGINERIGVEDFKKSILFYVRLIRNYNLEVQSTKN